MADTAARELTSASVLAAANERSGLNNLHSDGLDDRLDRLVAHLDGELGLDAEGKEAGFESVVQLVAYRAMLLDDRDRDPAIAEEPIGRPIFVTGLPRSGTTFLHALLGAHPGNWAPRWWEVARPSPPPGLAAADDPRLEAGDLEVAEMLDQNPLMLQFHPYFDRLGRTVMECEAIGAMDLRNVYNAAYFRVPALLQVQLGGDEPALFEWERKVLQAIQHGRQRRRWALKGTEHHARLEGLKEVFDDAIVVWLHRDPLKVMPSLMELLSEWFGNVMGVELDRSQIGPVFLEQYKAMLDAGLASPLVDHPDVYHLLYSEFVADPVGAVGEIYRRYDLELDDEAATAMRAWAGHPANRGDRHGKTRYSLDAFEISPDELDATFAAYRQKFEIPYE